MKNDIFQLWNKMHGIKMEKKYSAKQLVPIIYTLVSWGGVPFFL